MTPSTARDRAIEVAWNGMSAHDPDGDAGPVSGGFPSAIVDALCASPGVLRALAGEAEPAAARHVPMPWAPIPMGRVKVWSGEGRSPLWQALVMRLHGADAVDHHGLSIADAERLADAALDEIERQRAVPAGGSAPHQGATADAEASGEVVVQSGGSAKVRTPEGIVHVSCVLPGLTQVFVWDDPEHNPIFTAHFRAPAVAGGTPDETGHHPR